MKIAKRKSPSPFLVKLLLTIGLLVCLPMLITQLAIVYSSYHTLNKQNTQYYYMETQNLSARFYSQLTVFRTIALKISTTSPSDIKKCLSSNPPDNALTNASKELTSYLVSAPLAQNIGVYFIEQQIFLDDTYYYKLDNFCTRFSDDDEEVYNRVYDLFTQPFEKKIKIVSSMSDSGIAPGGGYSKNTKMIVAIPVKLASYTEYDAIVYFTLSYDSVCGFLSINNPAENYTYSIFDNQLDLLFTTSSHYPEEIDAAEFLEFLSNPLQSIYTPKADLTAYKWTDDVSENTFVITVTESALEENSSTFFRIMEVILLLNFLFTAVLLFATAYINYSPLRKLLFRISHGQEASSSELDQIEQIVQELDSRAADQGVVIMDYVLADLLYGTTVRQPELERLIPNFHFRRFCAVSVLCRRPTSVQSRQIAGYIEEQTGYRIYITDMPKQEGCLFVCLSQDDIDTEILTQAITSAVREILEESCGVFAGSIVEQLDDISTSYNLSQAKLRKDSSPVPALDYPTVDLQLLENQISIGNLEAAQESADRVFAYLQRNRRDWQLCQYLCYELLITYISAMKKTSFPLSSEMIRKLQQFKDIAELQAAMHASLEEASLRVAAGQQRDGNLLQQEIVQYVDENYHHTDISLVTVADRFNISIYMVSRLFKNQTGSGFKEYITAKRLELACRLLTTTQDSISSIAFQAGFEKPTYFTTLFRARYGSAPSKYREDARS